MAAPEDITRKGPYPWDRARRYLDIKVTASAADAALSGVSERDMGDFWAGFFVLGLVLPALLFVASTVAAFRLATRLQPLKPDARPRWQYLLIHLGFGFGLALPLGSVAPLAWIVVPGYLYWEVREAQGDTTRRSVLIGTGGVRHWTLAALFTITGVLVPWATGLGVKLFLDAQDRPTLPLSGFLDPASVAIEIVLTLSAWAFPFVLLASAVVVPWRVGFAAGSPLRDSLLPIWLAYVAGVLTAIPVFTLVFWEFDTLMLLMPVGLVLLPPMALGYFAGWWLLRRRVQTH